MRLLAVDTSSLRASVAVVDAGEVLCEIRWIPGEGASSSLLPSIASALERARVGVRELDAFAVTLGPGAFTGVRVGLATIEGLGLAAGRPCVGVSTLDVLAHRVSGAAPRLVTAIDAHRGEVFAASYDRDARPLGPAVRQAGEAFVESGGEGAAFFGDAALRYRNELESRWPSSVFPRKSLFLAATLGAMAEGLLREGRGVEPAALRPLYLRGADIR